MAAKRSNSGPWVVVVGCLAIVAGTAWYVRGAPQPEPIAPEKRVDAPADVRTGEVTLLRPRYDESGDLRFDRQQKPVPADVGPMAFAVGEYVHGLPMVPSGARVLSVKVRDGVATVDFSADFPKSLGSTDEETLVNGVLAVLGQFPDVKSVKFAIQGRPVESFGHLDLLDPQPVLHDVR
jgi:hypothetical protein